VGSDLFGIGTSGLLSSKSSLETTGHNISNVNTEGYSRQRVDHEARSPLRSGDQVHGQGVDVKKIKRIHDGLLQKRFQKSTSEKNYHEERVHLLDQVEQIFNEIDSKGGLNKIINDFFNSFRELANQPENDTIRGIVREKSQLIVQDFHRVTDRINIIETSMTNRMDRSVQDINTLSEQIAQLNSQIVLLEQNDGASANDLRDKRDESVKALSEYFEVNTYEDEQGKFVVNGVGFGPLVVGTNPQQLQGSILKDSDNPLDMGKMEVFFKGRPKFALNKNFTQGKLKGIIETRDQELKKLRDHMDKLAYQIAHATNAIHRRGHINKSMPLDIEGNPINDGTYKQVTNINFFEPPQTLQNAARNIDLSELIKESPDYIAAAISPNAPADNRVAIAITKLQHEKITNNGSSTLEEDYLRAIGDIGVSTAKSRLTFEHTTGILAQIKTMKERISGVSLDEEAANMVKFQQQYQASARTIKASEDMFNSLIGLLK
jgi:flagellar hook-associated protein 1 FlgK